jgi:hypothetical protein
MMKYVWIWINQLQLREPNREDVASASSASLHETCVLGVLRGQEASSSMSAEGQFLYLLASKRQPLSEQPETHFP